MYICMYVCMYVYIYIYIYGEREKYIWAWGVWASMKPPRKREMLCKRCVGVRGCECVCERGVVWGCGAISRKLFLRLFFFTSSLPKLDLNMPFIFDLFRQFGHQSRFKHSEFVFFHFQQLNYPQNIFTRRRRTWIHIHAQNEVRGCTMCRG